MEELWLVPHVISKTQLDFIYYENMSDLPELVDVRVRENEHIWNVLVWYLEAHSISLPVRFQFPYFVSIFLGLLIERQSVTGEKAF